MDITNVSITPRKKRKYFNIWYDNLCSRNYFYPAHVLQVYSFSESLIYSIHNPLPPFFLLSYTNVEYINFRLINFRFTE